jgi:hypothetical protein
VTIRRQADHRSDPRCETGEIGAHLLERDAMIRESSPWPSGARSSRQSGLERLIEVAADRLCVHFGEVPGIAPTSASTADVVFVTSGGQRQIDTARSEATTPLVERPGDFQPIGCASSRPRRSKRVCGPTAVACSTRGHRSRYSCLDVQSRLPERS